MADLEQNREKAIEEIVRSKMQEINKDRPQQRAETGFDVPEGKTEATPNQMPETSKPSTPTSTQQSQSKTSSNSALQDLQKIGRQNQVKALCEIAFAKGISEAIDLAKKLDNAYILDELHDTLVDELYNQLVESNKLKQI